MRGFISVRGARQHNLKNIDLDIPLNQLSVVTGLSGSGKSSLAFDTLYAEGQRRYAETFSPYTRQFLDRMEKPDVDKIEGIPPAIAIGQANAVRTSRSTVGTMTEIADYLKMLFPRRASLTCPVCGREIRKWSVQEMVAELERRFPSDETTILFEIPFPAKTPWDELSTFVRKQGYQRILWQEDVVRLDQDSPQNYKKFSRKSFKLSVIQDRVRITPENRARLAEALEMAMQMGKGILEVRAKSTADPVRFSNRWVCPYDGTEFAEPTARLFAFNSPLAACPTCKGFGRIIDLNFASIIPDRSLSIQQGAVKPWQTGVSVECQRDLLRACQRAKIPINIPFNDLSEADQKFIIEGEMTDTRSLNEIWEAGEWYGIRGFFQWLESKSYKMHVRVLLSRYRSYQTCPDCGGSRFKGEIHAWKLGGLTLPEINRLPISEAEDFFRQLPDGDESSLALLSQIRSRLGFLTQVGLGYLTLDRPTRTLSGGELQRVNLTTCLGTSLVGTLFILDEPSIGLHPRDTEMLSGILKRLVAHGNTVLVVEHDEAMIERADHVIELGPLQGERGGELVFQGNVHALKTTATLTGDYLAGRRTVPLPDQRRPLKNVDWLTVKEATCHNLVDFSCRIPLRRLVCITGVSGSGKSTLVHEVLYKHVMIALRRAVDLPPSLKSLQGAEAIDQIILVDQTPLAQTPRSAVILFLGVYDQLRELFANTEEARQAGYAASAFSFNAGVGRCERCNGTGFEKISMQFLSDLFLPCPQCGGKRFKSELLRLHFLGHSIDQWLGMSASRAIALLGAPSEGETTRSRNLRQEIVHALQLLEDVGLGYLSLGQPLSHLSGGEAQRLKLASHLAQVANSTKRDQTSLLILDEPTTGLHLEDIRILGGVLQRLVDAGQSLVVIEHNLDVIKLADWIIDLGPEAGVKGGQLVAEGTPEDVGRNPDSLTGRFLQPLLTKRPTPTRVRDKPPRYQIRSPVQEKRVIQVRGARHHNLKNINLDVPLDQFVVLTGLSGSGKSTLAFDLLFAEGQRRYLDCLNNYARQFVEQLEKPAVDSIIGLPPAVAIEQRTTRGGSKSTVATVTEIYQFLRLLYAKLGVPHDPETGEAATRQTEENILNEARAHLKKKGTASLLAPVIKSRKGYHTEIAKWAEKKGYPLLRVDGSWVEPADFKPLDRYREHTIEVVLGDIETTTPELPTILHAALEMGKGTFYLVDRQGTQTTYSSELHCESSGLSFDELDPRQFSYNSPHGWCPTCQGFGTLAELQIDGETEIEREQQAEWAREGLSADALTVCPDCKGSRLNPIARAVTLKGHRVDEINHFTVTELKHFLAGQKWTVREKAIARDLLPEINQRLAFLEKVGLAYLNLDRGAPTLSGGESQRIRLAAQMGSNLQGVLYVLDEPTIGLHPRDNDRLLETIRALKGRGNSLVVVEHDEDTIRAADHIIDLGPGAGVHGGEVVAQGSPQALARDPSSLTARILGTPLLHPGRGSRRTINGQTPWLKAKNITANNLNSITVQIPMHRLTVIAGVSGSGKSTLMRRGILPLLRARVGTTKKKGLSEAKTGLVCPDLPSQIVEVDQSPIGKNSRSTVSTYLGVMNQIRDLFAQLPESRVRGFAPGHFSHNAGQGRCPTCLGQGLIKVEMNFMPSVYVPCETCNGKRYRDEILAVTYRGKSIHDVLEMSVTEAVIHFAGVPNLASPLQLLEETGLGYLKLGQTSPTLSGGESQRLRLVSELAESIKPKTMLRLARGGKSPANFYLLEEPTVGLHLADVDRLIGVLHRLVDAGHTVVVIEHNLDLIAEADYLIELGPESGPDGGKIVVTGDPEEVAKSGRGHTARYLAPFLKRTQIHTTVATKKRPARPKALKLSHCEDT
jgi:excinuclease ABC subunit A